MVRNYKRKTGYGKAGLDAAIEDVPKGIGTYEASRKRTSTSSDWVSGKIGEKSKTLGRSTNIPVMDERKLAESLSIMEKMRIRPVEVGTYICSGIECLGLEKQFKNEVPGNGWFRNFKNRNNLNLKKPQSVEYARKKSMDPFVIHSYFDLLEKQIRTLGLANKPELI